jgi:HEPN domain-containing protein
MTKDEHIKYWLETAEYDWEIVFKMFNSKDYLYSLFFSHLTIEKLSKAIWVKFCAENYPPKTHNILYILEKVEFKLSEEQKDLLLTLNNFQLEGRYPDYKRNIYTLCTKEYTENLLNEIKKLRECLLKNLQ